MSFYGNITNVSKSQFSFDKIYSSRYEMAARMTSDGIYPNRFVLIEYDTDTDNITDSCFKSYYLSPNEEIYTAYVNAPGANTQAALNGSVIFSNVFKLEVVPRGTVTITSTQVREGEIIKIPATIRNTENIITSRYNFNGLNLAEGERAAAIGDKDGSVTLYYVCSLSSGESVFTLLTATASNFVRNYNIDIATFGASRGYDSTVWQKTFANGVEKYIMIAELNAITPTFGITVDAPTAIPMAPHVGTDSTNAYFQLHCQPAWGFRIKAAENSQGPVFNEEGDTGAHTNMSADNTNYQSDYMTEWNRYDLISNASQKFVIQDGQGTWIDTESDATFPAAIYFNRAGFDPETISYSSNSVENEISITPTGYSGRLYNNHANGVSSQVIPDTQELSIMLPALGDAMASIWDIVYGGIGNGAIIQPDGSYKRNTDINWDSTNGIRLVEDTLNPTAVATIAGCINSIHDLMGMIIIDVSNDARFPSEQALLNYNFDSLNNHIYYYANTNKYYWIHETFIDDDVMVPIEDPISHLLYYQFDTTKDYYILDIENRYMYPHYSIGQKWNISSIDYDANLTIGTRQSVYRLDELNGFSSELNTINGLIVKINQVLDFNNPLTRNINTVQGALNYLQDIINNISNLYIHTPLIVNNLGQITSATIHTEQNISAFSDKPLIINEIDYDCSGDNYSIAETVDSMRRQWITVNTDGDINNPKFTIHHNFQPVANITTRILKNFADKDLVVDNVDHYEYNHNDNIVVETPIIDLMGHTVGTNIKTYDLPKSYQKINIGDYPYTEKDAWSKIESYNSIADAIRDNADSNIRAVNFLYDIDESTSKNFLSASPVTSQDPLLILGANRWIQVCAHGPGTYDRPNKAELYALGAQFDVLSDEIINKNDLLTDENIDSIELNRRQTLIDEYEADLVDFPCIPSVLSILHTQQGINVVPRTTDLNDTTDGIATNDVIRIFDINVDSAGHAVERRPHYYGLPKGFRTFRIINHDNETINCVADTVTDTLALMSNNDKINLSVSINNEIYYTPTLDLIEQEGKNYYFKDGNNVFSLVSSETINGMEDGSAGLVGGLYEQATKANNIINISHKTITIEETTNPIEEVEGSPYKTIQFVIPSLTFDDCGHVVSVSHNTEEWNNVGQLQLINYSTANNSDLTSISSLDTVNSAFGKLQGSINELIGSGLNSISAKISTAVANLVTNAPEALDTLGEIATWIQTGDTNITSLISNVTTLQTDVGLNTDAIAAINDKKYTVGSMTDKALDEILIALESRIAVLEES